ncbi:MAG: hypothetical protein M1822_008884 [Bathelium mastoideum]|nr:MAG: hypothetical protein M1822_008884 [Bathelium mastoideum]
MVKMLTSKRAIAFSLLSILPSTLAQTFTACNPLNSTGCPTDPALGTSANFTFNSSSRADPQVWNATAGSLQYQPEKPGAEFIITNQGDSPTITSAFYFFFGRVSVMLRAASGTGIVSSIVLESDDLDEVDWEFLGGNRTHAETNFFGKGNTTSYNRAIWYPLPDNSAPQDDFHNYTVTWTQDALDWYIDGHHVRQVTPGDAITLMGKNYPQTPMTLKLGIWAGGDPKENAPGVVQWAGGVTDYTQGPFTMYVQSVEVVDYTTGASQYSYGDETGSWQSIKVVNGTSSVTERVLHPPKSLTQHVLSLSHAAKVGIAIGAIAVAAVLLLALAFCCIVQRRKGAKEKWYADREFETTKREQEEFAAEAQALGYGKGGWVGGEREVRNVGGSGARWSKRFSKFTRL